MSFSGCSTHCQSKETRIEDFRRHRLYERSRHQSAVQGDLFAGAARTTLAGSYLFHFNLTGNRRKIGVDDPRVEDRVADNLAKFDITESEEFLIGRDFGVGTDIQTGPNGNLYVVSLSNGAVYEVYSRKRTFSYFAEAKEDK